MPAPMKKQVTLAGVEFTMYSIRFLAKSIRRSAWTLRRWERQQIIPKPVLKVGNDMRWYTPEEVDAYTAVFDTEDLRQGKSFDSTQFTARLFAEVAVVKKHYAKMLGEK